MTRRKRNVISIEKENVMGDKKILEVKDVSFGYDKVDVLKNVSFVGNLGEVLVLAGPNGSGKTTLIKLIFDLLERKRGEIYLGSEDVRNISAKSKIMYLQSDNMIPQFLTGDEYVKLMCKMYNTQMNEELYGKLVKYYEMDEHIDSLIESYSHGMVKKIQLIMAFLIQSDITVIDETLNGIDIKAKEISSVLIKRMVEKNKLIILCTHDLLLAEKIGDRVELMHNGRIFADVPLPLNDDDKSLVSVFKRMIGFEESKYEL